MPTLAVDMQITGTARHGAPHRKTCKRYDVPGDAHRLTFSCFRRLPLLNHDQSRMWLIGAIELSRTKAPSDLWAYVIMPEHVHLGFASDSRRLNFGHLDNNQTIRVEASHPLAATARTRVP